MNFNKLEKSFNKILADNDFDIYYNEETEDITIFLYVLSSDNKIRIEIDLDCHYSIHFDKNSFLYYYEYELLNKCIKKLKKLNYII